MGIKWIGQAVEVEATLALPVGKPSITHLYDLSTNGNRGERYSFPAFLIVDLAFAL